MVFCRSIELNQLHQTQDPRTVSFPSDNFPWSQRTSWPSVSVFLDLEYVALLKKYRSCRQMLCCIRQKTGDPWQGGPYFPIFEISVAEPLKCFIFSKHHFVLNLKEINLHSVWVDKCLVNQVGGDWGVTCKNFSRARVMRLLSIDKKKRLDMGR